MSIATYADLLAKPGQWLRRTDLDAQAPDFVSLTEAEMNRRLRLSQQLVSQSFTIDAEFVDRPIGFRMMRTLRLTSGTGRELRELTPEEMTARKAVPSPLVGEPREYTGIGAQFEFYPIPQSPYPAIMEFQKGFTPLSDANPTNWILTDHPDAYMWGVLAEACAYLKQDERAAGFADRFVTVLGDVQDAMRTTYDRRLRVDPAIQIRPRRGRFNILSGGY